MRPKTKKILKATGLFAFIAFFAASCTANFCTPNDQAQMLYQKDGVAVVNEETGKLTHSTLKTTIITNAKAAGLNIPSDQYFVRLDAYATDLALDAYVASDLAVPLEFKASKEEIKASDEMLKLVLSRYGYVRYLGVKDSSFISYDVTDKEHPAKYLFGNINYWNHQIKLDLDAEGENGLSHIPDSDFAAYYQEEMLKAVNAYRACIAIAGNNYGTTGEEFYVESKSWGQAWKKGLLEGLFVFPTAFLIEKLTIAFGAAGWGQVGAIILVTLIVRGLLILVTWKSTLSQQRMTALQPEMAKLQEKYPNANTNNYEKQALAQAQMDLYKKNGVKPMSSIITMFIQMPIFIAIWGAMNGSAILASDSIFGLNLSASLGTAMMANWFKSSWWTALVLFVLMGASQYISMKLPQWMQKKEKQKVTKLGKNPAVEKQAKTQKTMQIVMFVFIIIMSWTLPAAMGIYWFVGALISIGQTLITQKVMAKKKK